MVTDTIDETTTNIRDAGRRTWTAVASSARGAAAVPQKLVQKPLNLLLKGREAKRKGGGEHDSDGDGDGGGDGDALLPRGGGGGSGEAQGGGGSRSGSRSP